jgi:hypothetical protein
MELSCGWNKELILQPLNLLQVVPDSLFGAKNIGMQYPLMEQVR